MKYDNDGNFVDMSDKEVVKQAKKWTFWILILCLVGVPLIGAGIWGISVATSNTAGKGNAVKQKNTALNRTQAQALFHTRFEGVRSLDQRLTDAQVQLDTFNKAHPNVGNGTPFDPTAEQQNNLSRTLTGLQQQCRTAVADYNASTETYTLRDFKDSDLPFKMEATDPAFSGGPLLFSDFDCVVSGSELGK